MSLECINKALYTGPRKLVPNKEWHSPTSDQWHHLTTPRSWRLSLSALVFSHQHRKVLSESQE